jgi:hypothetical protein
MRGETIITDKVKNDRWVRFKGLIEKIVFDNSH